MSSSKINKSDPKESVDLKRDYTESTPSDYSDTADSECTKFCPENQPLARRKAGIPVLSTEEDHHIAKNARDDGKNVSGQSNLQIRDKELNVTDPRALAFTSNDYLNTAQSSRLLGNDVIEAQPATPIPTQTTLDPQKRSENSTVNQQLAATVPMSLHSQERLPEPLPRYICSVTGGQHEWTKPYYPKSAFVMLVLLFPVGLLCCLEMREKRCKKCKLEINTRSESNFNNKEKVRAFQIGFAAGAIGEAIHGHGF